LKSVLYFLILVEAGEDDEDIEEVEESQQSVQSSKKNLDSLKESESSDKYQNYEKIWEKQYDRISNLNDTGKVFTGSNNTNTTENRGITHDDLVNTNLKLNYNSDENEEIGTSGFGQNYNFANPKIIKSSRKNKDNNFSPLQTDGSKSQTSFSNFAIDNKINPKTTKSNFTNTFDTTNKNKVNASQLSINKSKSNISQESVPGERLYRQHIEKLHKKVEHVNNIKDERRKSEIKELQSKPTINKKSSKMIENSPDKVVVEERLLNYGKTKMANLVKQQAKKILVEKENRFIPAVGERSREIAEVKKKDRLNMLNKVAARGEDYVNSDEEIQIDINDKSFKKSQVSNSDNNNNNLNYVNKSRNKTPDNKSTNKITKNIKLQESSKIKTNFNSNKDTERSKSFLGNSSRLSSNYIITRSDLNVSKYNRNKTPTKINTTIKKSTSATPIKYNPEKNIHDFLYMETKLKQDQKMQLEKLHMDKLCPFTPYIPESVRGLVKRKKETQEELTRRLINSKKESEEQLVKQRRQNDAPIDKKTGRPLYRPTVGRGPIDPKTREVTVNLDGYYDKKLLSFKTKVHEEEMLNNLEKKKIFLEKSMKSILKMKIEKYKEVFDMLDSDKDGLISSKNIRLSALDSEMLYSLTPLLEEIQKKSLQMNFKDFCLHADKFLAVKIFNK
jgi:hypothetical protein